MEEGRDTDLGVQCDIQITELVFCLQYLVAWHFWFFVFCFFVVFFFFCSSFLSVCL